MKKSHTGKTLRIKRLPRIRSKLTGTSERPRIVVYRSNYALYAQFIDDGTGHVITGARVSGKNKDAAVKLGTQIAALASKKGIKKAVFDRSGYRYHGVVKALADAVREGGITI